MTASVTPIKSEIVRGRAEAGSARDKENVATPESWLSVVGGSLLGFTGLRKGDFPGLGLAIAGAMLVHRGLSGHCPLYKVLGVSTKKHGEVAAVGADQGVKIVRAVTIQRPAQELFSFWRNFENLPRVMNHLISVAPQEGRRSHWTARAPAGLKVEWDAKIVTEEPSRLIAWRSLSGSQIPNAGSVHFTPLSENRGTEVRVTLKYDAPGGPFGSWLAWAFGQEPGQQIREDLRRFRQLMETGETATITGQSSGREGARS